MKYDEFIKEVQERGHMDSRQRAEEAANQRAQAHEIVALAEVASLLSARG